MFGIVAVAGAYYVQSGEFTASALLLGLPVGALVTNVLVVDDIRDRDFDALKGWRTAAVRFGSAWSRRQYMCLSLLAYLAPFAFWLGLGYRAWVLLPLASLPWAVHIGRVVWASTRREALVPVTPRASLLALGYGTLLGLGLALS
jgi:1,4-dihydroxy-2-naphthoate octaprenyltransferase